jgi:hypothetical protein
LTSSTEVVIGDADGQHVLIRPLARSQPGLFDDRDSTGIDCDVDVSAGAFRGAFRADLRSEEFRTFLDDVHALTRGADGAATFAAADGQLAFSLGVDGDGRLRVSGEAVDASGSGNQLKFAFDVDHASLADLCGSLEQLLAVFPVRES